MEQEKLSEQTIGDRIDQPVMSNLTGDELQIVQDLCEIADLDSVFDPSSIEQSVVNDRTYANSTGDTNKIPTSIDSECNTNPNTVYNNTTPMVGSHSDGENSNGVGGGVIVEFSDATDLFSNDCVKTQINSASEVMRDERIREITADLMIYEQLGYTQEPKNNPVQLEPAQNTPRTHINDPVEVIEMTENAKLMDTEWNTSHTSDKYKETHIGAHQYMIGSREVITEFTTHIANSDLDLLNPDST
ncbi:hypothetical protein QAD02_014284 [Eretmocerus hayati]|uniref:Uncharacterized protein n=1 Tax=Eretmocerus hayati TaxID=131215 RepID=A0ACC2P538_9HYME|nr:hypothetical protein QAD02_014284 [Eretmocerus hayati]